MTEKPHISDYLNFGLLIAGDAGKIMRDYFEKSSILSTYKEDETIVTIADKEINNMLIERVRAVFPTHAVDGEEASYGKSDYVWVCDPIDGTSMFAHHIPVAVFSLALVYKGEPIVGIIYDPFNNDMYYATKGSGAYKNSNKINVNFFDMEDVQTVAHCDMFSTKAYDIIEKFHQKYPKTRLCDMGSIAHSCICVASGEFAFSIFCAQGHKNCDIAAAKIIVEEAGGIVRSLNGEEQRYDKDINGAIISNKVVFNKLVELINEK